MLNSQFSSEGVRIAMYGAMLEKVAPSDENWELGNWSDCRHVPDNMRGCYSNVFHHSALPRTLLSWRTTAISEKGWTVWAKNAVRMTNRSRPFIRNFRPFVG